MQRDTAHRMYSEGTCLAGAQLTCTIAIWRSKCARKASATPSLCTDCACSPCSKLNWSSKSLHLLAEVSACAAEKGKSQLKGVLAGHRLSTA